jgi:hypothetical protein
MIALAVGIILWVLLAVAALRYATIRSMLAHQDRIGALIFFVVIGIPVFVAGLALIAQSTIA